MPERDFICQVESRVEDSESTKSMKKVQTFYLLRGLLIYFDFVLKSGEN